MTDKDPKDMTASELLRKAGNGYEGSSGTVMTNLIDLMGLSRKIRHSECCYDLADKIDAELAKAREESLRQGAMVWAKTNGWPDFREGEDFAGWLDRCAIKRPCYEDGEVVAVGEYEDILGYCVYDDGEYSITTPDRSIDFAPGERVKRPAPEALGADGLPIKEGETVYMAGSLADTPNDKAAETVWAHGGPLLVLGESDRAGCLICKNDMGVKLDVRPEDLTHTPPDTQERIDADATMPPAEYCAVRGIDLGDDPDREAATAAMVRDLLRRQRELDKRTGGVE